MLEATGGALPRIVKRSYLPASLAKSGPASTSGSGSERPWVKVACLLECGQGLLSYAAVRSMVVVVLLPRGEYVLGLAEIGKPMRRETLSPERPVERFADAVLDRLAGA